MKPKTKLQAEIVRLDKKTVTLKVRHKKWARSECLPHRATRLKSGRMTCLDCAHVWQSKMKVGWHDQIIDQKCPNCKVQLEVLNTLKSVYKEDKYFTTIDVIGDFQRINLFRIYAHYKRGEKRRIWYRGLSSIYMKANGKEEVIGQYPQRSFQGGIWCGDWEIRMNRTVPQHYFHPYKYYPDIQVLPEIKRNGYVDKFHNLHPAFLFKLLLTEPIAETLIKKKQYNLLEALGDHGILEKMKKYWSQIKICIKHNYQIKQQNDWFDYLEMLKDYNRDLNSTKYICPKNFVREHDRYVERKRKERMKKELKELREELRVQQIAYNKAKKKYFNLTFSKGDLIIKFMSSVEEIADVGDRLRHCIYGRHYHEKNKSLLFCAYVNDIPMETSEFSLENFKVKQSRGKGNKPSKYHSEILKLINENTPLIKEITKPKLKTQKAA